MTDISKINCNQFVYISFPPTNDTTDDYDMLLDIIAEKFANSKHNKDDIIDILTDIEEHNPLYNTQLNIYMDALKNSSNIDDFEKTFLNKCNDFYYKNIIKPILNKPDKPSLETASKIANALNCGINQYYIYPITANIWETIINQFETAESIHRLKDASYRPGTSNYPEHKDEVEKEINLLTCSRNIDYREFLYTYHSATDNYDDDELKDLKNAIQWAKSNNDFLIIETGSSLEDAPPIILLNLKTQTYQLREKYTKLRNQKAS